MHAHKKLLNIVVVECETDLYLFLSWKIRWGQFPAYHQWVACPETGDIAILFADGDKQAQYNPVHYFNLFELLVFEPPL